MTPSYVEPDRVAYYRWVSMELNRLHAAVKEAREEQKIQDKQMYDKAHKTTPPTWRVNDRVWLVLMLMLMNSFYLSANLVT